MSLATFLLGLPVVETRQLPRGALFIHPDGSLYEVIDSGQGGEHRARRWRHPQPQEVALDPDSHLARRLPVVARARHLLPYPSRDALLENQAALLFTFRREQSALDAAQLDVALCGYGSGVYVRKNERYPCFEATNGALVFRQYFFLETNQGVRTRLPDIKHGLGYPLRSHLDGPLAWRLLPSWEDSPFYDLSQTVAMQPIELGSAAETHPNLSSVRDDDTLPSHPEAGDKPAH
ncbi:MAG: hypothetical protein HC915_09450 [Anaerolineae bacterium]|nr:hypothetical protein [Anaerolineae bacterium]